MDSNFYTVEQIKQLENCGRDCAYNIARSLPHKKRGIKILVLKEAYDEYHEKDKQEILSKFNTNKRTNVYQLKKFV